LRLATRSGHCIAGCDERTEEKNMTTRLSVAVKTDIGRTRTTNEDAFLFADVANGVPETTEGIARFDVGPRGALLSVSDGMGGHNAGEVASAMTLQSLYETLVEHGPGAETGARIKAAVEQANLKVIAAGRRPSLADMGATVTAILVAGGEAHIAEVGDSRAYLLRGGVLRRITEDQNFAQVLISSGQMTPDEANASPWRNVLLQAMGHSLDLKVALGTLALRQRDLLILCSDGLTSHVSDLELRNVVLSAASLDVACDRLVALANERGGTDNITVLVAGVRGDLPAWQAGERISDTYHTRTVFDAAQAAAHPGRGRGAE
jgi:PPM family protein phosphatase